MRGHALVALGLLLTTSSCPHREANGKSPSSGPTRAATTPPQRQVTLASAGRSRFTIYAPDRLFDESKPARRPKPSKAQRLERKLARQDTARLHESVRDLARYLGELSGSQVQVLAKSAPKATGTSPILIGELGAERFGAVAGHSPGQQTFRVVIQSSGIGLFGESDLATSYAIYELLDRLGCRWFMPGALGEVIPRRAELTIPEADATLVPSTLYRNIWYGDEAFKRRNRLGGLKLSAGHHLERWVSEQQRAEHPEWRAVVGGAPHPTRLRWSEPAVADAIAESISQQLELAPTSSVSLSPADGGGFDETLDRAKDAGDWDPAANTTSLTDRLLVLANGVAKRLAPKHPDLMLGLLAYSVYTRPPVRERVQPNVVPVIAPITYCRVHPWSDDGCPGARDARQAFEGWSARADKLAFRSYAFNLAEPAAPNPMLRKWSYDLPFVFAHKTRFFQPETLPNFETTLPALYLGLRLAWNSHQDPQAILRSLFDDFYGHASGQVRSYTDIIDRAWTETPEYSGGGLGYVRRFPPELLQKARKALNEAQAACQSDVERKRVAMLDASLAQLELYMKLERDFRAGHLSSLASDFNRWLGRAGELAAQYADNSAFGGVRWAGQEGAYAAYAHRFLGPAYFEADRIQREQTLLIPTPLCSARYRLAPTLQLPSQDAPPSLSAESDKLTNFCTETWSALGQHDYFGTMWYELELQPTALVAGKRAFVWLSKLDGVVQLWLNGVEVNAAGVSSSSTESHLKPVAFDVTTALRAGVVSKLTIAIRRTRLVELGAGGLLGPIYLYRER